MKRKYLDRSDWKRILNKSLKITYIKENDFEGYAAVFYLHKVREPLIIEMVGKQVCLADDGYIWMQHLPSKENYALTTMYDQYGNIVQWYFDIIKGSGVSEDGIPFYDDLYLDVVALPTSEIMLIDEDELQEALDTGDITQQDYDMAYEKSYGIMREISNKLDKLSDFSNKYLEYMEKL